ncbi:lipopolysaccharide assembly protein LapB [Bacteroides sp.]|uniref:tetratricopeptide repeat protein n=1 Tax=Bacteroides sp. TaxID=29523 RepID=UPI00262D139C|nr:tetratricopeptide repeat protein [Bacteroides sp.]MDD3040097.1 tetratricopeptide repeat protein [Bacteroides sp.]
MGRKNSPSEGQELDKLIEQYETSKAENHQIYLDGDQFADIADRYASERRFSEAQEVINYGLYLHPENTDLLVEQAYLYLDTQKIYEAKEVAASITEEYNSEVKMLKAELLLNEGKLEAAQYILNTIEEADELETIINIVYLYLDMGYPENAKDWLDRNKKAYENEEDFIAVTADYLAATNQNEAAITQYNQLIDVDPYNASYWVGLAKCYFITENCEKAIEACDFALAANEKFGEAYAYRAHSYFYLNNSDAAIADYQKAIEYKAVAPEVGNMFIGMAYTNKEDWSNADQCYLEVIRIFKEKGDGNSPLLVDTYTNAALATFELGNHEEAHQMCTRARKINPKEPLIDFTEGKLYLKEGLDKEAFDSFKKALDYDPNPEMWYLVATAYSEEEMLSQAKICYEEVYDIDPNYENVAGKLAALALIDGRIDDFFRYNNETANPINEDMIADLLSQPHERTEEGEDILKQVWERMKKEKGNK